MRPKRNWSDGSDAAEKKSAEELLTSVNRDLDVF
jgi:hypothetical protein